jgi:hypothetical protein
VQLVGALTADLDRRRGRDRQLDLAAEARERALELVGRRRLLAPDDVASGSPVVVRDVRSTSVR